MAVRPVFYPSNSGQLFGRTDITIPWHGGFSVTQKQKNVRELHDAARRNGFKNVLEVSSKSETEIGRRLSAFSLILKIEGEEIPFECAYQGSKVFQDGGPYQDLYKKTPIEAKKDIRIKTSGRIISFKLFNKSFPISPPNVFYDWIYVSILANHESYLRDRLSQFDGFTDIEFNPEKSINCQARAVAITMALIRDNELQETMSTFDKFERKISQAFGAL
ncbi:hypothetical protein ACCT14_04825 [Rhizobium brockwellii]|uniref:DarT1-associated NADAR antitoxin family protein n=1 Tax=Rhizobium brockwellii TaxID=3019932 RepID=UPI003F9CC63F